MFGFKRQSGRHPPHHDGVPLLPFQGGERVVIDVEQLPPIEQLKFKGLDLCEARVVAVTLGPRVMVRLRDHSTHWIAISAVTVEVQR